MKPVDLFAYQIRNSAPQGAAIIDLFGGSGTTLIACEKIGRFAHLMELDEKYCDVIVKRYVEFCKENYIPVEIKRNGEPCYDFN